MLSQLKNAGLRVVGAKQVTRHLENGKLSKVFIAQDADEFITRRIKLLAQDKGVEIVETQQMKELGTACGIMVGAAVAGLLKE